MALKVSGLRFFYKGGPTILDDLSLEVGDGQIASLLGRSGSGKTTVLNIIAGFLRPMRGLIEIDGNEVGSLPPRKRDIGMVMQDLALFPNMTVLENVEYGLRVRGVPRKDAEGRSLEVLDRMEMVEKKDRNVIELSGGERQRVALARSIIYRPKLLLMDEPLSSLDTSLREDLRKEVRKLLREERITTLYVTHDRTEALSISDNLFILDMGRIVESGDPRDIYRRPRTLKGASFMGVMTPVPILSSRGDVVTTPFGSVRIAGGGSGHLGYRPEAVYWSDPGDSLKIRGKVTLCDFRGRDHLIELSTPSGIYSALSTDPLAIGSDGEFFVEKENVFILNK